MVHITQGALYRNPETTDHSPGQAASHQASTFLSSFQIWGFPKIGGTFLGVPIIRIIIFWGLYWGPLI